MVLIFIILKGPWTYEEDELLKSLIKEYGEGSWSQIASKLPGRSGKQCRDHYTNQIDPSLNKLPFTLEEDKLLIKLQKEYNSQWSIIKKHMNNRSELSLKNRFKKLAGVLSEENMYI